MSLSAAEIGVVVDILNRDLRGAVVRKVISTKEPDRVVIELRGPGQNHYLQMVGVAGATRVGRIQGKPPSAESPHPFVMLLRKELGGMALEEARQLNGDRVIRFQFAARNRSGALVCELTSRHSNLMWLGSDDLIVG